MVHLGNSFTEWETLRISLECSHEHLAKLLLDEYNGLRSVISKTSEALLAPQLPQCTDLSVEDIFDGSLYKKKEKKKNKKVDSSPLRSSSLSLLTKLKGMTRCQNNTAENCRNSTGSSLSKVPVVLLTRIDSTADNKVNRPELVPASDSSYSPPPSDLGDASKSSSESSDSYSSVSSSRPRKRYKKKHPTFTKSVKKARPSYSPLSDLSDALKSNSGRSIEDRQKMSSHLRKSYKKRRPAFTKPVKKARSSYSLVSDLSDASKNSSGSSTTDNDELISGQKKKRQAFIKPLTKKRLSIVVAADATVTSPRSGNRRLSNRLFSNAEKSSTRAGKLKRKKAEKSSTRAEKLKHKKLY